MADEVGMECGEWWEGEVCLVVVEMHEVVEVIPGAGMAGDVVHGEGVAGSKEVVDGGGGVKRSPRVVVAEVRCLCAVVDGCAVDVGVEGVVVWIGVAVVDVRDGCVIVADVVGVVVVVAVVECAIAKFKKPLSILMPFRSVNAAGLAGAQCSTMWMKRSRTIGEEATNIAS
ncbi:hypothetical protein CBR_g299 [Chara braunii]|uniref:Uncharacterized protein n=1 Tax=Chara braunii TaxID=69332 RepID=A0A388JQC4_CHABU|nr:hypothetical protein CBR_g299 [Chara braunii]|eukprot:GBG59968.1 hypothetical protein CBR_g299 [Chara braunii]